MLGLDLAQVFIGFIVLLFSLTVHETAHAWTADRLGDPTARLLGRVSLNPAVHVDPIGTVLFPLLGMISGLPVIGWAKPVPVNVRRLRRDRRDYVLVAAAGPASNLAIAVMAAGLLAVLPAGAMASAAGTMGEPLLVLVARLLVINVYLAVFNMLPIPPLDGGNVLSGLLPSALAYRFDGFMRPYGFILLYALMFTGAFGTLVGVPAAMVLSWLR